MQVMGNYSQELFNEMWAIMENDYEEYTSYELIDKLNDFNFINPFHKRLLSFYNDISGECNTAEEAKKSLLRQAKKNGVYLNPNTINNWLSGEREPKYGDDDRQRLFAVAFALGLDVISTERLFHRVFLDRAFNKRNINEFIFLHCINNDKPYTVAMALIDQINSMQFNSSSKERTIDTGLLHDVAKQNTNESDLIRFIVEHPYNFELNNTTAKEHRQRLLNSLVGTDSNPGLAQKEYDKHTVEQDISWKWTEIKFKEYKKRPTLVDFLLYVILGVDFVNAKRDEILAIRDIFQRKEVITRFPDKQTLSCKNPSSYSLRKDIILLYFYFYWVNDFLTNLNIGEYDSFVDELDTILFECGFSPLYVGNPYDWLFMYCSTCVDDTFTPLDRFRGIFA